MSFFCAIFWICSFIVIKTSNITDTSFDFTIYLYDCSSDQESVVFKTHTAVFVEDGMKAVYDGQEYYLTFTFPDTFNSYPVAIFMDVSGYEPIEGLEFANNSIPGYGFS